MDYSYYKQILDNLESQNIKYDQNHYNKIKYTIQSEFPWGTGTGIISGVPAAWNSGEIITTPSGLLLSRLIYNYWVSLYSEPS